MDFKHRAAGRVKKTIPGIPSGSAHAAPPFCHFDRSEGGVEKSHAQVVRAAVG